MNTNFNTINLEQGSPKWIEFRNTRLGGSDIPSLMNLPEAYGNRTSLIQDKINPVTKEHSEFTKRLFQDGHDFELAVRESNPRGFQFTPQVVQHKSEDRFISSLDGINLEHQIILEVKSTRKDAYLYMARNGLVPEVYNYQIQWCLFVTGYEVAHLYVVDSTCGDTYFIEVKRDQNLIDKIVIEAHKFLAELSTGIEPYIQLENITVQNIANIKNNIKHYKKLIAEAENQVQEQAEQLLKEYKATKIEGCGVRIQIVTKKGSVQYKKIEALKGIDLDKYRAPSSSYVKISELSDKDGDE